MRDWRDGIKRIPLHLLAFGVPSGVVAWWFPWYAVVGVACLRLGQEIDDVTGKRDTIAKAVIDFASSIAISLILAIVKNSA